MRWNLADLADHLHEAIQLAESALNLEQAVKGFDDLDERQFHELLAAGLASRYSVHREVHYPSSVGKKLTSRKRCDLVLAPIGKPLRLDSTPPSLFDPIDPTPPTEALWLEVKIAYQFREGQVRHGGYGNQWQSAVVEDLRKMEAEPLITEAALVLVVFTENAEVIAKDLELFEDVLVRKEVLAGFRQTRAVAIVERIGHRICTVAVYPTIQR